MGDRLPIEIMYEILSRIPVKSLDRFRCVCKEWCNYIDDPKLSIIHLNRAGKQEPIIPIMFKLHPDTDPSPTQLTLFGIAGEAEAKRDSVLELDDDSRHMIKGSCNGLLYVSKYTNYDNIKDVPQTTLSVIHPLRNQRYDLPPSLLMESCGLGFDESTNTFKMCVSVYEPAWKTIRTMVHVLGDNNTSWREIPHIPRYLMKGECISAYSCLHWLGFHNKSQYIRWRSHEPLPPNQRKKVICFDIRKEEFRMIDPPRKTGNEWDEFRLVDLHGEVGLVYHSTHSFSVELWALKENNQWVFQCQIDAKPPLPCNVLIDVVGLWNKSGDILVTTDHAKQLFVYSLKTRDFRQVNLIGWEDGYAYIHMYRSSLFTVPGIKKSSFLSSNPTDFNFCSSRKRKRRRKFRIQSKPIYRFLKFC